MPLDPEASERARSRLRARLEEIRESVRAVADMPGPAGEHARELLRESVGRAVEQAALALHDGFAREVIGWDRGSADGDVGVVMRRRDDGVLEIVDILQEGAVPNGRILEPLQGQEVSGIIMDEVHDPLPGTFANEASREEEQVELELNRQEYRPTLAQVSLDEIDVEGSVLEPTAAFVENVRRLGITQPVALVRQSDHRFKIAAGRRRVRAAGLAEMTRVPALVFPVGTPLRVAAAIALSENTHRAPNPITDLEAIESLMREGHSREQIAHSLRIPLNVLDARMLMGRLSPEMRTAVANGRIAVGVAQRIARLDATRRATLENTLAANGRLSGADVRAVMQARTDDAVLALPDSVFAPAAPATVAALAPEVLAADRARNTPPEPTIDVDEQSIYLNVRNRAGDRSRAVRVTARATIDTAEPVRVAVDDLVYVPETTTSLEFQGEARVRARTDGELHEVARMVARWSNGQQTTIKLRREAVSEQLPSVEVGGEQYIRARERVMGALPAGEEATVTTPNGAVTVRCEQDENGLEQWTIGGREFISREAHDAWIVGLQQAELTPLDQIEESWVGVLAALERAEAALPAAPDANSERMFGLVMEAVDIARTMMREETGTPAPVTPANPAGRIDPRAAARALQQQDATIAQPPHPPRRRAR